VFPDKIDGNKHAIFAPPDSVSALESFFPAPCANPLLLKKYVRSS